MILSVEVKPDFHNTVSITDFTREFNEYVPEETLEVLLRYFNFKYSQTCTLDIIKYLSSEGEELINAYYSDHSDFTDLLRIPLPKDGFYGVTHIVLPTIEWYDKVKDENLTPYSAIYVTDGLFVYKVKGANYYRVDVVELDEINPEGTTISKASFNVFTMDALKHCYANAAELILNSYIGRCKDLDSTLRFNRDFLWMTINVISYYLEWGDYARALLILENVTGCRGLCPNATSILENKQGGCGCNKG